MAFLTQQRMSITLTTIFVAVGTFFVAIGDRAHTSSETLASKPTIFAPQALRYFVLGYNEIVADSMWLRTIQDFDYCENSDPNEVDMKKKKCSLGWVYHMIDSEIELAPKFRQPYLSGALMLTVLVNDIAGASAIFDKAVAAFPSDGQILFNAAYQAMIEEHDSAKASRLLIAAGKNGAPPWVFALAARLQQKSGQLELAKSILTEAKELNVAGPGAERIQQRLDEVEKELAKQPKGP